MVTYHSPDGSINVDAGIFNLNWHPDTPDNIEVYNSQEDDPVKDYVSVNALRDFVSQVAEAADN